MARFLKPGGFLYFAEGHPAALVLDDDTAGDGKRASFFWPYLGRTAFVLSDPTDYADPAARLANATTHQWLHPLSDVITALIEAGLRLDWLHEHDAVPWRMLACMTEGDDGLSPAGRTAPGFRSRIPCERRGKLLRPLPG